MNFPPRIDFMENTSNTTSMPRLPTYEEATGRVTVSLRLPSYREGFGRRYHPYRRSSIPPDPIARLMYTALDDEYIELYGIPPALPPRPVPPLVPGPLIFRPRDYGLRMERRARLNMMILNEFVAGLHRARRVTDTPALPAPAAPRCALRE